ncbi:MAG: Asr1405/Asl0597 family protein [Thermosynechococcaceae cyanobacterium]
MHPSHISLKREHQVIAVPSCDRRQVQRRLQDLSINAWCSTDGSLRVEVNDHVESAQVWSVVQQFIASRTELVGWLEQCWS